MGEQVGAMPAYARQRVRGRVPGAHGMDLGACREQRLEGVAPDEPARAGDEHTFHALTESTQPSRHS